jgi:hypothetical protein
MAYVEYRDRAEARKRRKSRDNPDVWSQWVSSRAERQKTNLHRRCGHSLPLAHYEIAE